MEGLEDGIDYDLLMKVINQDVTERGEWAGAPAPVHGLPLVLEKRYPYQKLNGFCFGERENKPPDSDEESKDVKVRNSWYSHKHRSRVYIIEEKGKVGYWLQPEFGGGELDLWLNTIGASRAWSLEAEITATMKLRDLVTPAAFRYYMLTGTFLETSKKSGVTYLFRKLRPTVALTREGEKTKFLASLCLHPLGYYEGSWAGVMTPTDDLTCHLLLMRGDERKFWAKANHHPIWAAQAGI